MIITSHWLSERGCCARDLQRFAKFWPKGARLTRRTLRKAVTFGKFDLRWLAYRLLTLAEYNTFITQTARARASWYAAGCTLNESTRKGYAYRKRMTKVLADILGLK